MQKPGKLDSAGPLGTNRRQRGTAREPKGTEKGAKGERLEAKGDQRGPKEDPWRRKGSERSRKGAPGSAFPWILRFLGPESEASGARMSTGVFRQLSLFV